MICPRPVTLAGLLFTGLLSGCVTTNDKGQVSASKPDLTEAAKLNTQLGIDYARQNQDALALEKLRRAVKQDPSLAEAQAAIAFVYARRGDDSEADAHYRRALELNPADPATRNNYGVFLCAHKRAVEADRYFLQAAQDHQYQTPEAAWTNAGVCARRLPDLPKAQRYFREALKANPGFPDALSQMAWLSYQLKDYPRARAFLQRYQQAGPPTPETLLIGALTERALGDKPAAAAYEQRLRKEFPESEESGNLSPHTAP